MRCATCAEKVLLGRLLRRRECPHCHLPLRSRAGKVSMTSRADEARLLLDRPTPRSDEVYLAVATVVTAAVSLTPTAGVLTGLVLPLMQVYCIERTTRRLRAHFDFLHGVTSDLEVGLIFLLTVAAESMAGVFLGPAAAPVNVTVFLLAWAMARAAVRSHVRRLADGRGPHPVELAALTVTAALLVVPPVLLAVGLVSAFGQLVPDPQAGPVQPAEFFEVLGAGVVLSLDLFLLPLWACLGLVVFGFVSKPVAASWVGSWWAFGLVTVALGAEVLLDNALDRRLHFSRTLWPRLQFLLTPLTLLAVVLTLGQALTWPAKAAALFGALSLTGVIKFGGAEPIKNALGLLPGSLAQRKALLYTAPFRIAAAIGMAVVARVSPSFVMLCLAAAALAASMMLLLALLVRWRARRALRIACRKCGYRVHELARLCPACHEPVLSSRIVRYPPEVRKTILQLGIAFAWAEGGVGPEEEHILGSAIRASGLPEEQIGELSTQLASGLSPDQVALEDLPARFHGDVLEYAASVAGADDVVATEERELWRRTVDRLTVGRARNSVWARLSRRVRRWSGRPSACPAPPPPPGGLPDAGDKAVVAPDGREQVLLSSRCKDR